MYSPERHRLGSCRAIGPGFEAGGPAVAHAMAQGYTVLEKVNEHFLHGEMVAKGVLTQLALESW